MGERTYAVPQWVVACLLAYFDDDCRPDHHGPCQAHTLDKPCPVAVLRATHTVAAASDTPGPDTPWTGSS